MVTPKNRKKKIRVRFFIKYIFDKSNYPEIADKDIESMYQAISPVIENQNRYPYHKDPDILQSIYFFPGGGVELRRLFMQNKRKMINEIFKGPRRPTQIINFRSGSEEG